MAMDRLAKIDAMELRRRMRESFERTMDQVTQAVNDARDGHLINDSEEQCRDVLGEFRRLPYEAAVQMRVEATEADPAFSPGGGGEARDGQSVGPELQRADPIASPAAGKHRGRGRDPRGDP